MNDITHPDAEIVEEPLDTETRPVKGDPILNVLVPIFSVVGCLMAFPAMAAFHALSPSTGPVASTFITGFGTALWCSAVSIFGLMILRLGEIAAGQGALPGEDED
jgi:hypothetical protein